MTNQIIDPHAARLAALRTKLAEGGLAALLISQPQNRRYLSGFRADDAALDESSGHLLITAEAALLLTDFRYAEEAAQEAPLFEVKVYRRGLAELLAELGDELAFDRLGFEADWLTYDAVKTLTDKLERIKLSPTKGLTAGLRLIKSADEVAAMERSLAIIEEIMANLGDWLQPGKTEAEAAWFVFEQLAQRNATPAFPTIVAAGENGAKPHAVPGDRVIAQGEPIVVDAGAKLDGYCSDITRTFYLGEPDAKFKEVYSTVRRAQLAALAGIKPGLDATAADALAREVIAQAGYGEAFGHSLGHGVGLATHEGPSVGPVRSAELTPGMIFTVEPGIYLPGWGGVRLEVMAHLTEQGLKRMGDLDLFYEF